MTERLPRLYTGPTTWFHVLTDPVEYADRSFCW